MWLILLSSQLLLLVHAQFVPNANCPHPIYATQADVAPWVGITVDTTQKVEIANGLNLFKCTPDTLFFYIVNGVFTRQNWWLACGSNLNTGWRVRDAGSKNTAYGNIPVGCAKPTCTGLQMFDGNEYILRSYSNYEVIPHQPIVVTNGKFQIYCTAGSVLGYASSGTTITIQTGMSVFCEAEGWWLKTSAASAGSLLSAKVGCFKQIAEPVLPAACQTGITYFTGDEQILKDNSEYLMTADRAVVVSGKWKLNCPSDCGIGYAESGLKFTYATTATITCDSYGWWLVTSDNPSGSVLSPDVKVGCFRKQTTTTTTTTTSTTTTTTTTTTTPKPIGTTLAPTTAEREANPKIACGCWFEFSNCPTCNWQKMFVLEGFGASSGKCTLGCAEGYVFEGGNVNMISCVEGYWFGSPKNAVQSIPMPTPQGWLETSCVPAATPAKCSVSYSTFDCEGCDSSKIIPLQSAKSSSGCVLSCNQEYRLLVLDSTNTVTRAQEAVVEVKSILVYPLGNTKETIKVSTQGGVKYSCEPATTSTAPVKLIGIPTSTIAPTTAEREANPKIACGCWFEFSNCPSCNWQKMFVLEGFGYSTGKCTLGCAEGYEFEGGEVNMLSCQGGNNWFGSSSTTAGKTIQMPKKGDGWLETSCVPATTAAKCAAAYSKFNCEGCDSSKIIPLRSTKSSAGCVLSCNQEHRLLVLDSTGTVTRAQEAILESTSYLVYPLGRTNETLKIDVKDSYPKFSCEPASNSTADVKLIGEVFKPKLEECGCPFVAADWKPHYDYTKLFVQDSSPDSCTLQCDVGYSLILGWSSLTCKGGTWWLSSAGLINKPIANFSCEAKPATCDKEYSIAGCPSGRECNSEAVRLIPGRTDRPCILSCARGYRLITSSGTVMNEIYWEVNKWRGKQLGQDYTYTTNFGSTIAVNCERYISASEKAELPPYGSPTSLSTCGCWYKASTCPTCDSSKLFILDGFGATSGRCTLGCAKGYMLEGGQFNLLSCRWGKWFGSSKATASAVSTTSPEVTTSCVPVDTADCPTSAFTTFECDGCDKSKISSQTTTNGCALVCDKGFRLMAMDAMRTVFRAQEAVFQQASWTVYPLGQMSSPISIAANAAKFSCEPVARIVAPTGNVPTCGCPWEQLASCTECDNSKMIVKHDGASTCVLTCVPGYQLVSENLIDGGVLTAAVCSGYKWFGRSASLSGTYSAAVVPSFGCVRTATAALLAVPPVNPFTGCSTCAPKLIAASTWTKGAFTCSPGFTLIANTANSVSGAQQYAEISVGADNKWSGVLFTGSVSTFSNLFVACVVDNSTKPIQRCGCPYANLGPDTAQLQPRSVWPDGNNCELMCEPGYYMKSQYDMSLVVCQAGKWVGRNYNGDATITMAGTPSMWCNKMTTDYFSGCSNPDWLPLQCAGCSVEFLLPVPSGYTCQFTCRAGWRLVAQHQRGSITRPRAVYLQNGDWKGTGGQGLLTTLYYGVQPLISCEPDTYPPPSDPASVPKPAAKPCEYCKLPFAQSACPAGKSCAAESLPLWKTADGCMQVRCRKQMKMLINNNGAWITTDGLNCEANGSWKTMTGVLLSADVSVTCDSSTAGEPSLIEVIYNIFRKGINLIVIDPNYVSPFGG